MPKLHDKAIIRLDTDEVAKLLDYVESCGSKLTGQALSYYNKTKERDIAIHYSSTWNRYSSIGV